MSFASPFDRLKRSLIASAGTIVFGMEDGTVSIFGLIFGVSATTSSTLPVLIAGATGAAAAAVSMMAGTYLDAETSRDGKTVEAAKLKADLALPAEAIAALLPQRLGEAGLNAKFCDALAAAVKGNTEAQKGLLQALQTEPGRALDPCEQALWMLVADFFSAAIPILPFVLLPITTARIASATVTTLLLIGLGIGRATIGKRSLIRTVAETVSIGIAAALAGVGIGMLLTHGVGSSSARS